MDKEEIIPFLKVLAKHSYHDEIIDANDRSFKDAVVGSDFTTAELMMDAGITFSAEDIVKRLAAYSAWVDTSWFNYIVQQKIPLQTVHPKKKNGNTLFMIVVNNYIPYALQLLKKYPMDIEHKDGNTDWDYENNNKRTILDITMHQGHRNNNEDFIKLLEMLLERGARKFDAQYLMETLIKYNVKFTRDEARIVRNEPIYASTYDYFLSYLGYQSPIQQEIKAPEIEKLEVTSPSINSISKEESQNETIKFRR